MFSFIFKKDFSLLWSAALIMAWCSSSLLLGHLRVWADMELVNLSKLVVLFLLYLTGRLLRLASLKLRLFDIDGWNIKHHPCIRYMCLCKIEGCCIVHTNLVPLQLHNIDWEQSLEMHIITIEYRMHKCLTACLPQLLRSNIIENYDLFSPLLLQCSTYPVCKITVHTYNQSYY